MGKENFKIGDMVRHKSGAGLTYEVIGTAYDLGWITLCEKLSLGGAEPFPCTNYEDYEVVPNPVLQSTANHDTNSCITSFLKDRKDTGYKQELKRLSEQPIKGYEELKETFCKEVDEYLEKVVEYKNNAKFFMMLQVSIAENMTLREAYEKFDLKYMLIEPIEERYDKQNIRSFFSDEYRFQLVRFDKPHRISNDVWRDFLTELYASLIKKLELEII